MCVLCGDWGWKGFGEINGKRVCFDCVSELAEQSGKVRRLTEELKESEEYAEMLEKDIRELEESIKT